MKVSEQQLQTSLFSALDSSDDFRKKITKLCELPRELDCVDIQIEYPPKSTNNHLNDPGRLDIFIKFKKNQDTYSIGIELKKPKEKIKKDQIKKHLKTLKINNTQKKNTKYLIITGDLEMPDEIKSFRKIKIKKNLIYWMSWYDIRCLLDKDKSLKSHQILTSLNESGIYSSGIKPPNVKFSKKTLNFFIEYKQIANKYFSSLKRNKVEINPFFDSLTYYLAKENFKNFEEELENLKIEKFFPTTYSEWIYKCFRKKNIYFIGFNFLKNKWILTITSNKKVSKSKVNEINSFLKKEEDKTKKSDSKIEIEKNGVNAFIFNNKPSIKMLVNFINKLDVELPKI